MKRTDCSPPLFEIEPNNEELYIQKANIFSKKDQHEKAIQVFKEAIEIAEGQCRSLFFNWNGIFVFRSISRSKTKISRNVLNWI